MDFGFGIWILTGWILKDGFSRMDSQGWLGPGPALGHPGTPAAGRPAGGRPAGRPPAIENLILLESILENPSLRIHPLRILSIWEKNLRSHPKKLRSPVGASQTRGDLNITKILYIQGI